MKLASLRNTTLDGELVVVSRNLSRIRPAATACVDCHIETLSPRLSDSRSGQTFTFIKLGSSKRD